MRCRPSGPFLASLIGLACASSHAERAVRPPAPGDKGQQSSQTTTGPVVPGSPADEIRSVIRAKAGQVSACYEGMAPNPRDLRPGKVRVGFDIKADGAVADVQVLEDTFGDPGFLACVRTAIEGWSFPKPKGGGIIKVTYPFVFRPTPTD